MIYMRAGVSVLTVFFSRKDVFDEETLPTSSLYV